MGDVLAGLLDVPPVRTEPRQPAGRGMGGSWASCTGGRGRRSPKSWAGEGTVAWTSVRRRLGGRVPGEVGADERGVEHVHRVRLPYQALGLVGAVWRLDAPQMHPGAVGLRGLDGGHHVLVARDQHRVGDGTMPGQGLNVGADVGVHALLLAARVEVAEAELHPCHLGDDALIDGRHRVAGRVVPVDPEQLASEQLVGVFGNRLDEADRVDRKSRRALVPNSNSPAAA